MSPTSEPDSNQESVEVAYNRRLAIVTQVEGYWHEWLERRHSAAHDQEASVDYRSMGAEVEGHHQSDYDEHSYIVSASSQDWLAFMAMLIARGVTPDGGPN